MRATCVSRQTSNCFGSVADGFTTCSFARAGGCRNAFRETSTIDVAKARLHTPSSASTPARPRRRLRRRLLKLLAKLRFQWNGLRKLYGPCISLSAEQEKRLCAVREVCLQQSDLFAGKEVRHRIVSIDRPYLRPIVRGKENKRVEFGAKVNNIQIDGISFIEHHSFEAFNEGIRLKQCIEYQESLTGVKVKRVGADSIYANNANRTMCTEKGITTCFVRKGPRPKEEAGCLKKARRIIGTLRATVNGGQLREPETALCRWAHQGTQHVQRNIAALLRNPYGKCRRPCRKADGQGHEEGGLIKK